MQIESTVEIFELVSRTVPTVEDRRGGGVDGGCVEVGPPMHLRAENIFIAVCSVALAKSIMTVDARE